MSSNRSSQMGSQLGNWAAQLGRLMGRLLAGWVTQGRSRQRLRNATQLVLGCHSKLQYLAATVHGLETQKLLQQCLSFSSGTWLMVKPCWSQKLPYSKLSTMPCQVRLTLVMITAQFLINSLIILIRLFLK